jgi:hypothetical protein
MKPPIRPLAALCVAVAAALAAPAAAHADLVVPGADDCPEEVVLNPFAQWNDHAAYVRVDDGGLEAGGVDWRLARADVVEGNHPWPAVDPADRMSLAIRNGGTATTPSFCVGLGHPTIRFFTRRTGGPLGVLVVQVVVTTSVGLKVALPIGLIAGGDREWRPSPRLLTVANLLTLFPDERTRVAFRFTAIGIDAGWRIDDVFVDPYAKR